MGVVTCPIFKNLVSLFRGRCSLSNLEGVFFVYTPSFKRAGLCKLYINPSHTCMYRRATFEGTRIGRAMFQGARFRRGKFGSVRFRDWEF